MKRREFIALLGGVAAGWPVAARAQQPGMPVIGFLGAECRSCGRIACRRSTRALPQAGFVEGRNVAIEYRWAHGHNDRLPALAADLIRPAGERHRCTNQHAGDARSSRPRPRRSQSSSMSAAIRLLLGLVASLNRPGGNLTGVATLGP